MAESGLVLSSWPCSVPDKTVESELVALKLGGKVTDFLIPNLRRVLHAFTGRRFGTHGSIFIPTCL